VWVVTSLRRAPAAAGGAPVIGDTRARVAAAAALLLGFCFLLPWIGYPLSALVFTGLLLRALGGRWMAAAAIALASALVSYYVFATVLGVPLPRGVLFD
jgi:putative tricarboxylic transport membrane protein